MALSNFIDSTLVNPGQVALFSLAQAGFFIKTPAQTRLVIDPYLSDYCRRKFGFRRMMPPVIGAGELRADLVASTHAHPDHLDPDSLPVFARCPETSFLGAPDCESGYREAGLAPDRFAIIARGQSRTFRDVAIRAVYADHGDLAPDAVGFLLDIGGITIYDVGDSGYSPAKILPSLNSRVDIMIAPINAAYGNLGPEQACELAAQVKPRVMIASHFWMFIEHGGDPAAFLAAAARLAPGITPLVMAPGERILFDRQRGLVHGPEPSAET